MLAHAEFPILWCNLRIKPLGCQTKSCPTLGVASVGDEHMPSNGDRRRPCNPSNCRLHQAGPLRVQGLRHLVHRFAAHLRCDDVLPAVRCQDVPRRGVHHEQFGDGLGRSNKALCRATRATSLMEACAFDGNGKTIHSPTRALGDNTNGRAPLERQCGPCPLPRDTLD